MNLAAIILVCLGLWFLVMVLSIGALLHSVK